MKEAKLGKGKDMYLLDPLDLWIPKVPITLGSSARVFRGSVLNSNGFKKTKAIKIMRPDELDYALPLFMEEIVILQDMKDVSGVVRMHEYGLIRLDDKNKMPTESPQDNARLLTGNYVSIEVEEKFDSGFFEKRTREGWLPYISLDLIGDSNNLLRLCTTDPNITEVTGGRYGPNLDVKDGIRIAIQICEILSVAHSKNIVYRDHKILHYYWNGENVLMIDWNVGLKHSEGLSNHDKRADLVQFGARMLFFAFTGRYPIDPSSGRTPSGLGPTRPDEIQNSPDSYAADWDIADKRLPDSLKQLLQAIMAGEYFDAKKLSADFRLLSEKLT